MLLRAAAAAAAAAFLCAMPAAAARDGLAGGPTRPGKLKVGSVSDIKLDNGDALVTFTLEGKYGLGSETQAHIRTGTLR